MKTTLNHKKKPVANSSKVHEAKILTTFYENKKRTSELSSANGSGVEDIYVPLRVAKICPTIPNPTRMNGLGYKQNKYGSYWVDPK